MSEEIKEKLKSLYLPELKKIASSLAIRGRSKLRKIELIDAIYNTKQYDKIKG